MDDENTHTTEKEHNYAHKNKKNQVNQKTTTAKRHTNWTQGAKILQNLTRNADKTIKHNKISAMISKVCLSCCKNKECESQE